MQGSDRASPEKSKPERGAAPPDTKRPEPTLADLLTLQRDTLKRLNAIAARVQEGSNQAAADFARTLNEARMNIQAAQQQGAKTYMAAMCGVAGKPSGMQEVNDVAQRSAGEFEAARSAAEKSVEEARAGMGAAVKESAESANRDWDSACAEYIKAIQDGVARLNAAAPDPAMLAALAQSLLWVAGQVRKPAA